MSFEDAVRAAQGGAVIDFDVSPGAKETRVPSGYNEWRKRIEVKLKAPPERGKANEELIVELSSLLGVPESSIEITSGTKESRKSVRVTGLKREDIVKTLGGKLR
ncbi:MAG TPA: DUF167 domain-containing protein [Methanocella sp.]|uniref:DUF167 domain-containing protein n=1 Tax=Methanocella sp. TaxID=2052833 RepID=UPI002C813072|nr:DUF167 domain-containing protein [Methanocella sp.]HTY89722.1 DUF167 domain-containing protein [Methanocella sp.]